MIKIKQAGGFQPESKLRLTVMGPALTIFLCPITGRVFIVASTNFTKLSGSNTVILPTVIIRKDIVIFNTSPRRSHHLGYRIPPFFIVEGFLMLN